MGRREVHPLLRVKVKFTVKHAVYKCLGHPNTAFLTVILTTLTLRVGLLYKELLAGNLFSLRNVGRLVVARK